jgi:hypothetical protein
VPLGCVASRRHAFAPFRIAQRWPSFSTFFTNFAPPTPMACLHDGECGGGDGREERDGRDGEPDAEADAHGRSSLALPWLAQELLTPE